MAKLKDKLYNRIIEGKLFGLTEEDAKEVSKVLVNKPNIYYLEEDVVDSRDIPQNILSKIKMGDTVAFSSGEVYVCLYLYPEDSLYLVTADYVGISTAIFRYDSQTKWTFSSEIRTEFDRLPLDFDVNTHSFSELDSTIKRIVDDAIADSWENGVACTQNQWNAIKKLLDKSLYLYYNDLSLIKTITDGFSVYKFGLYDSDTSGVARVVDFQYDYDNGLLFAQVREI